VGFDLTPSQAESLSYMRIQSSERICSTGFTGDFGMFQGTMTAYKNLPIDAEVARVTVKDRFNPRTGEYVVEHGDTAVVQMEAIVNHPLTTIQGLSFDGNTSDDLPQKYTFQSTNTQAGRRYSAERELTASKAALPTVSTTGTAIYTPEVKITGAAATGSPGTSKVYPLVLRVESDERNYDVDKLNGEGASLGAIKANMTQFATIMANASGASVSSTEQLYRNMTDGSAANNEIKRVEVDDLTNGLIMYVDTPQQSDVRVYVKFTNADAESTVGDLKKLFKVGNGWY
jgi:hypothetical protein